MKTTLEILREARELISVPERWTQKAIARDASGYAWCDFASPKAACWCTSGALRRIAYPEDLPTNEGFIGAWNALEQTLGGTLAYFNDTHSHSDVLRVFDETIARLEKTP